MAKKKGFPKRRRFEVLRSFGLHYQVGLLSGGVFLVHDDNPEHLLRKYAPRDHLTLILAHQSGRYEHREGRPLVSLMHWDLDQMVKNGDLKEIEPK